MIHNGRSGAFLAAATLLASSGLADAQGIPVIDQSAIAKHIESITQLKSQLDALNQQIAQAQQLYGSMNKITDMADVAGLLNNPAIRKALPQDFNAVESLLRGSGSGVLGSFASKALENNSTYRTSANDFYAKELARVQQQDDLSRRAELAGDAAQPALCEVRHRLQGGRFHRLGRVQARSDRGV